MNTYDERHFERYFGSDYDADTANRCLQTLDDRMKRLFRTPLELSPGLTGVLAWRRTSGDGWAPLPFDVQQLIRDTSGQGRFEVCPVVWHKAPLGNVQRAGCLPDLYCLDLRLAYLASAMSMGSGKEWRHEERPKEGWPEYHSPASARGGAFGFLGYTAGRYRVQFTVPDRWPHVGILPFWHGTAGVSGWWGWPTANGGLGPWATWADAAEVRLAIECGWEVEILERLVCVDDVRTNQRPLRYWAERLWELYGEPLGSERMATLWRTAIRNIVLQAVGLFAYRPKTVTRRVATREEIETHALADETYRRTEEGWEFEDYGQSRGVDHLLHPEFAAAVWADTRVRLLRQNAAIGGEKVTTGALTLPREQIVGFGLDALYLTHDPLWPDDGKPGRYRCKSHVPGPLAAPTTRRELEALTG